MNTFETVRRILAQQANLKEDEIQLESTFEQLGLDSLDLFQMLGDVEEELGVRIDEVEQLKSIDDVVKAIDAAR